MLSVVPTEDRKNEVIEMVEEFLADLKGGKVKVEELILICTAFDGVGINDIHIRRSSMDDKTALWNLECAKHILVSGIFE